ncbi:MAG: flagellin [Bdellovibrionales bacterium RIFOXYD1_FULL_44_7]|nr:MAG: flagellin [Bdellovibrionales bacterium RIFOXYD1_FULL_44_7]
MGLRINTNAQSLAAQRSLSKSTTQQRESLEKLSSGARINKSADDAAGMAIAEKMRAQIRSLRQAVRNANDGISIIQTTEGGMNEIAGILIRFRELSIQAASDTIGDTERSFVDKEVQQLVAEIDRIAESVEFNGKLKLLNGQGGVLDVQIGLNNNPQMDRFQIDQSQTDVRTQTLGLSGLSVSTKQSAQDNLDKLDNAIKMMSERRANLGAIQNRLQSTISSLQVYDENLSAARSRIFDTDIAAESSELTKNNILTSAGVSVLAQANQTASLALKLLG